MSVAFLLFVFLQFLIFSFSFQFKENWLDRALLFKVWSVDNLGAQASLQITESSLHFDKIARRFLCTLRVEEQELEAMHGDSHSPHCYPQKNPVGHDLCSVTVLYSCENSIFKSTFIPWVVPTLECMSLQELCSLSF